MNPCKTKWQQKWLALDVVHDSIQGLATAAEAFCGRWFKNNPTPSLLVIYGNSGSGKTHTARSIFRFCHSASMSAFETQKWGAAEIPQSLFVSWPEAAVAFGEKEFGIVEDAMKSSLVVLDDVGAENDPWKVCADRLCQILSRREKMFTVITTNINPNEWASRFDIRIADRMLRNSVVIDLSLVQSYATR